MLKILIFLLCTTLVSTADSCRRTVPLSQTGTCGPQQTMYNEGECLCCYYDTKKIPTIGIGFNLHRKDAADIMKKYNLILENVLKDCTDKTTNNCLTAANAEDLFNTISYPEVGPCVDNYAPGLPPVVRAAVMDLAFAGCKTLKKFVDMQTDLKNRDWKAAANELRDSLWCRQVGSNRCNSDYNCIANTCTGETCNALTSSCSSNSDCYCYQTSDGTGFCGINDDCASYPDCTSCSSSTSVCLINTCCGVPVCVPLSNGQDCTDPPTYISKSNKPGIFKRPTCKEDQDCPLDKVCKLHMVGSFCV